MYWMPSIVCIKVHLHCEMIYYLAVSYRHLQIIVVGDGWPNTGNLIDAPNSAYFRHGTVFMHFMYCSFETWAQLVLYYPLGIWEVKVIAWSADHIWGIRTLPSLQMIHIRRSRSSIFIAQGHYQACRWSILGGQGQGIYIACRWWSMLKH